MTYGEVERLGITQHGHGVTVAMNPEQYRLLKLALWSLSAHLGGSDGELVRGMMDDIRERGI